MKAVVTASQRSDLARQGYLLLRGFVDDATAATIRRDAIDLANQRLPWLTIGKRIRTLADAGALLPRIRAQMEDGPLHALAARLMRCRPRLIGCQLIVKPAGCPEHVHWHRDAEYAATQSDNGLTFWVALTAATTDNGCLWYLPRSHRTASYGDDSVPEALVMAPGDLAAHTRRTLHRSGPNTTKQDRWALMLEWVSGEPEPA
jgi:hypothetical protein